MFDFVTATCWVAFARHGAALLRHALGLRGGARATAALPRAADVWPPESVARAQTAQALGYRLCRCEFPPRPMLWSNARRVFVCQNPDCGRAEDAARG